MIWSGSGLRVSLTATPKYHLTHAPADAKSREL
jgi:hypothetical protein